jgi:hypothetical protein
MDARMAALPDSALRHILLTATTFDDLIRHVARCSLVCREWRKIVQASPCSALTLRAPHRENILKEISSALREAAPGGSGKIRFYERLVWGDEGGEILGAALQALPRPLRLSSINLSEPRCLELTASGMASITAALHRGFASPGLLSLNVSGNLGDGSSNPLGDDGLTALAAALPVELELLKIGDTCCGDVGMSAIARKLPALTQLRHLCCSDNPAVQGPGWAALSAALPQLTMLRCLSASGNGGLDDCAATALAQSLPTTIETLYLCK